MNKKLLDAENDLLALLKKEGESLPPDKIFAALPQHAEAELRAAFWTLRARGDVEHHKGKIVLRK